jgi:ankyrin repeat protein
MMTMGYPDTTEQFIEAGAKVNLTDKNHRTALDYAMEIDTFRKEIISILKKAGAVSGTAQPNKGLNRTRP